MKISVQSTVVRWLSASVYAAAILLTVRAQAQPRPVLTRHVREAVANGQAQLIGLLPATQRLPVTITLPLRNEPALDIFLRDLYDPSSLSFVNFSQ
jgi:hypothetical protein